jgi:hypothetical protein
LQALHVVVDEHVLQLVIQTAEVIVDVAVVRKKPSTAALQSLVVVHVAQLVLQTTLQPVLVPPFPDLHTHAVADVQDAQVDGHAVHVTASPLPVG